MFSKKEFQKVVAAIRKELNKGEYPKALCTGAQMMKNQATVNCGGEGSGESSKVIAQEVLNHSLFKSFLLATGSKAALEHKPDYTGKGYTQIRLYY